MSDKIKVTIDRDDCISCATCWSTCPEFFEENPDDFISQVIEQYRLNDNPGEGEAPQDLADCVQDAADGCPVQIIRVV
jgi:ferredoxin